MNRELLIEAGLSEFGLLGYHGASTASIARRADVAQPHFYAHFEAKQELFLACLERAARLIHENPSAPARTPARFLYQAVAAAGDVQLSITLAHSLSAILRDLGQQGCQEWLVLAATSLLSDEAPDDVVIPD